MQVKVFTIAAFGGQGEEEVFNRFLRSHRVLDVQKEFFTTPQGGYWSFCVQYIAQREGYATGGEGRSSGVKKDYRKELEEAEFERFKKLREIRKTIALEDAVPAFVVFTDEELAGLSRLEALTPQSMKTVRGVGDKKVAKYAERFLEALAKS